MDSEQHGISPAPIHGDDVAMKIVWKSPWAADYELPLIVHKSLYIAWEGRSHTPKGHPFPALYVSVDLTVPAGAALSSQAEQALKPYHVPATDRDQYSFDLPIRSMEGNSADFFLKLVNGESAEFNIEYRLHVDGTVYGLHTSCEKEGVKITEKSGGTLSAFLLARCVREDRMLYINILKPLDLKFVATRTNKQLLETSGQPVLRVSMRPEQMPRKTTIGEIQLIDSKKQSERYEITLESSGPSRWRLALGLLPTISSYTDKFGTGTNLRQLPLVGALGAGFLFLPGFWEINLDARATLVPINLSNTGQPPASWYSLGYHLGALLPVGEGDHVFGFYLGWYHYFMTVPDNSYGMPRQGLSNISGPQLIVNMRYRPLGALGWSAYFKYAPLSDTLESLDLLKFQHHDVTVGVTHDLPWFARQTRRPALALEAGFLSLSLGKVDMTESHASLGFIYPLL
ncbi:MAG: hypothetical protein HY074_11255 [Deltaproteobacteria bacterium]|nr:hypothetical protein [Deltaproteobacteria bacterium]